MGARREAEAQEQLADVICQMLTHGSLVDPFDAVSRVPGDGPVRGPKMPEKSATRSFGAAKIAVGANFPQMRLSNNPRSSSHAAMGFLLSCIRW